MNENLRVRIEEALDEIRPRLQADGGDVSLVDLSEEGVLTVALEGACGNCPFSLMTLKNGIELIVKERVPEVKEVVSSENL